MNTYRIQPYWPGPQTLLASDVKDIIDWGLLALDIPKVWQVTDGADILIGVCDSGCPTHVDLSGRVKCSKNFSDSTTAQDMLGHSTHVCGIIAAERNGQGVVGVAPKARLCVAKVIGDSGIGDEAAVAEGIDYCISKNCDIISLSLAGSDSPIFGPAILRAVAKGILVVCAAGNTGKIKGVDTITWPARMDETLAIGSYNKNKQISKFSARGSELDFAFPGEDILSCWPGNSYRRSSGTSMAAPFCSGLLALLLSYMKANPNSGLKRPTTATEAVSLLRPYSRDIGVAGHDDDSGWGFLSMASFSVKR